MKIYILLAIIFLVLFLLVKKENYFMGTYVMSPRRTGVYPTAITDYYWYDRYINRPYVRYAAVPYRPRRWRRRWWWY